MGDTAVGSGSLQRRVTPTSSHVTCRILLVNRYPAVPVATSMMRSYTSEL